MDTNLPIRPWELSWVVWVRMPTAGGGELFCVTAKACPALSPSRATLAPTHAGTTGCKTSRCRSATRVSCSIQNAELHSLRRRPSCTPCMDMLSLSASSSSNVHTSVIKASTASSTPSTAWRATSNLRLALGVAPSRMSGMAS